MTKKMSNLQKLRLKLCVLTILSFWASLLPPLITIVNKWDVYAVTPAEKFKLATGGFLCIIFLALKARDKLKMPRRIVLYAIIFVMAYLLQAMIQDIVLLSGMALLGEFIDWALFQGWIKRTREQITIEKTANATATAVKAALGGGNGTAGVITP